MSQQPKDATPNGTIRPLSGDDLEVVIELDTALGGASRRGFFEKRLSAALETPKDYVYVGLFDGDTLLGYAMSKLIEGEFGKTGARAFLDAIGVAPDHQSHGAGQHLLSAVKEILYHKGVGELESQVDWADRALLRFFGDTGFVLAPRIILTRSTEEMPTVFLNDEDEDELLEIDHSSENGDDFHALSRDKIPVRSMKDSDLAAIISIDRKLSGEDRTAYFNRKQHEVFEGSGVRISLVAELEGYPAGFIMARLDFGEFGHTVKEAVMDTIGVDPGYQGQGVGQALMSQLIANLAVLRVEGLRTEIDWNDADLVAFFDGSGFAPAQRMTLVCAL